MFKAFLKRVEETTDLLGASLKLKDNKQLDFVEVISAPAPPLVPVPATPIDQPPVVKKEEPAPPVKPPIHYNENIDLHPGGVFLKKYKETLDELHKNNVILAKKAEAVDRKLPTLVRHCTNHHETWKKLQTELSRMPDLSLTVSNIRNQIDVVLVKMDEMELLLNMQVESYHARELVKYKDKLIADGDKYQTQKQKELASLEEELATSRAKYERDKAVREKEQARLLRVEQAEQQRKKEAEDLRQSKKKEEDDKAYKEKLRSALGNAFQHQMDQFKKFGGAGVTKKEEPVVPIESIVPEENPEVLEDFLKESNDKLQNSDAEEVSQPQPAVEEDDKSTIDDSVVKIKGDEGYEEEAEKVKEVEEEKHEKEKVKEEEKVHEEEEKIQVEEEKKDVEESATNTIETKDNNDKQEEIKEAAGTTGNDETLAQETINETKEEETSSEEQQ